MQKKFRQLGIWFQQVDDVMPKPSHPNSRSFILSLQQRPNYHHNQTEAAPMLSYEIRGRADVEL